MYKVGDAVFDSKYDALIYGVQQLLTKLSIHYDMNIMPCVIENNETQEMIMVMPAKLIEIIDTYMEMHNTKCQDAIRYFQSNPCELL